MLGGQKKKNYWKKRKQEESKNHENEIWKRLSELNNEFKKIKKAKKDSKKMSHTIKKM